MPQVIQLCRRCGFEIPSDAPDCPGCARFDREPTLAARQVAGLALPTRSVHRLPTTPPRRPVPAPPEGPAEAARTAFSFTGVLVSIALLGLLLGWVVRGERFVLSLPDGVGRPIHTLTTLAAWASVIGLATGLGFLAVRGGHLMVARLAARVDAHEAVRLLRRSGSVPPSP